MNGSTAFKCENCNSAVPHEGIVRALAACTSLDEVLNKVDALIDVHVERKPLSGHVVGFDESVFAKVRFWCQSCLGRKETPRNTQFEILLDQNGGLISIGCLAEKPKGS
jgi:hypothetical protein